MEQIIFMTKARDFTLYLIKYKFLLNEENEIPQDQDPQQIHERFRKYVTDVQEGGFVSERSKALQNPIWKTITFYI